MPFFIYGRDASTGEVLPRLFSMATTEADARAHGLIHGMDVSAVIPCREADRPPDSVVAAARSHLSADKGVRARGAAKGAARRAARKVQGEPAAIPEVDEETVQFKRTLDELTPGAYVCNTLIAVNLAIFVVMVIRGVGLNEPTIADLLSWGAGYGPKTLYGEWWRLFTSMFVHIGWSHVAYNMLALAYVGPITERMLGNVGFLVLYVVAGIGGGLLALHSGALTVHAGASGAVFGVYGALLAQLIKQGSSIPPKLAGALRRLVTVLVVYGLVSSLGPSVSMAAHIGGLLTGFICGLVLAEPVSRDALGERPGRALMALAIGVVLTLGGFHWAQSRFTGLDRLEQLQSQMWLLNKQDSKAFDGIAYTSDRQGRTDAAFADYVERDVLPQWRDTREQFAALQPVPPALVGRVAAIADYMRLRQVSCELIVTGLRAHHPEDIEAAKQARSRAMQLARQIR